jgi:hypothetical protein
MAWAAHLSGEAVHATVVRRAGNRMRTGGVSA